MKKAKKQDYNDKIRVLHPITRLTIGGASENTIYTCELLDNKAFETAIACGAYTGSEGELITDAQRKNIKVNVMNELVRAPNPVMDFIALMKLVKYMKKENPLVVHTHSSKAGIIGRTAAWLAGVPVIVHTVHGWGFNDRMNYFEKKLWVTLEKWVDRITDKIIVVSSLNIDKGLAEGISKPEKYTVIHSGVDIDLYKNVKVDILSKKRELGISEDSLVVGTVARFTQQKSPLDFLRAANIVIEEIPNAVFVYVGDGPLRGEVEAMINEFGISKNVILTGFRSDVPELLAVMDIFSLSSLWEGLPRVFLEAMSAGKPIVATNVDGAPDAVKDGVNGFLVPPGDYKSLADGIIKLLKEPDLMRKMGEASQNLMNSEFSVYTMVQKIQDLYFALLAEKGLSILD